MMRLDDSREARLLKSSTPYSSLETSMRMSEFDVPMSRRGKGKGKCYAVSACIAIIAFVAIVGATVGSAKRSDASKSHQIRSAHKSVAPAPSPKEDTGFGGGWASSPPAPAVEASTEPVASPQSSPQSSPLTAGSGPSPAFGPSSYAPSYDLAHYETICGKTINRAVCLSMFASNPNSHKVDLQQWTIMTMEAAEHALNESYVLAMGLTSYNERNVALQQCIDVFADALDQVGTSMFLVAGMDPHYPGQTGTDVQTSMSAAMTNQDTCQEGIDDIGPFPGSDQITGPQAKHVNTMLSIALTFVNQLTSPMEDPNHHRRLLHIKSIGSVRRT